MAETITEPAAQLHASLPSIAEVQARASAAAFGSPLIVNALRGLISEIIIGAALGNGWAMCSGDWRGWDFEHADGCRLEVKQSAARQTWDVTGRITKPIFDIRERTGFWDGAVWTARRGRLASIYVFAHHPVTDESADHRDARQWRFHVVPADRLPATKTISLRSVAALAQSVEWGGLGAAVEAARASLSPQS